MDVFTEHLASPESLRGYQILIGLRERTRFDAAFFAALPQLELIAQTGSHAYHVDLPAASRAGVLVALASTASATSTVELTFALMLSVMRQIPRTDRALRAGEWPLVLGRTLSGKRLGILGLGRVGREVARLALAFGMELSAWGPTLTPDRAAQHGATYRPLDDLLEESDLVSIHLALSDSTRGLLDESRLRRVGPAGVLVNTARGAIVDEDALARLLATGQIGGAGLDVYALEPLPANSPLRQLENVVLTSHLGWPADATYRGMAAKAAEIIEAYVNGEPIAALNPEARPEMPQPTPPSSSSPLRH